jgi:hypothetical protein
MRGAICYAVALLALLPSVAKSEAVMCNFRSVDSMDGRPEVSGSIVRSKGGAIVEFNSGSPTLAMTCPTAFQCTSSQDGLTNYIEFSYSGFIVFATYGPALPFSVIGLAKLDCD